MAKLTYTVTQITGPWVGCKAATLRRLPEGSRITWQCQQGNDVFNYSDYVTWGMRSYADIARALRSKSTLAVQIFTPEVAK